MCIHRQSSSSVLTLQQSGRLSGLVFRLGTNFCFCLTILLLLLMAGPLSARTPWPDSPLAPEVQVSLERAGHDIKSGKPQRAAPAIESALSAANDIPKCLAIASFTETYGYPLMEVRRK